MRAYRVPTCLVIFIELLLHCSAACGQTLYLENFEDGDPSHSRTWTDYTGGDSNASSGDLILSDSPLGMVTSPTGVANLTGLSETSVRTQIKFDGSPVEPAGVSIVTNGDPAARNSYYQGGIDPFTNDLFIGWNEGFTHNSFLSEPSGFDFADGEEITLQFDVIDNKLSLWAWPLGDEMPVIPQLQYIDEDIRLAPGIPGLLFDGGGSNNTAATYRYFEVAADSIPPTPETIFDNFDDDDLADGSPLTWNADRNGVLNASDGQLSFTDSFGIVTPDELEGVGWTVESRASLPNNGDNVGVGVLYGESDNVWLGISPDGTLRVGTPGTTLDSVATTLTSEDVMLRLEAFDDVLAGWAWEPGESRPEDPMIRVELSNVTTERPGAPGVWMSGGGQTATASWDFFRAMEQMQEVFGDFNSDGTLTAGDLDLLGMEIRNPTGNLDFDLTGDGLVDIQDHRFWVEDASVANTFLGDLDLNQNVDFEDFLALSAGFGGTGGWAAGDIDATGTVDFADFLMLSANFGNAKVGVVTVPEPLRNALFLTAIPIFLGMLRRSRVCPVPSNGTGQTST